MDTVLGCVYYLLGPLSALPLTKREASGTGISKTSWRCDLYFLCVCAHVWRPEVKFMCHQEHGPQRFLRNGWDLAALAKLTSQQTLGIHLLGLPLV